MNINQIRYFEVVLEEGSFSAAARAQYVTVQAVSKAIADLERELGQALFVRENRCVRPTEFGLAFHAKALPALAAFKNLEAFAENHGEDEPDRPMRMLLCAPAFPGNEVVVPNLGNLLKKATDVEVDLSLATVEDGLAALFDESADAIFTIGMCARQGVDCTPVGTMRTAVAVKKSHPIASKRTVTIEELNRYPVILSDAYDDFADSIMSLYAKRGLASPAVRVESNETEEEADRMMEQGAYAFCANIPTLLNSMSDMTMVPVEPADAESVPICICTLKGKSIPAYRTLVLMASNPSVLMSIL